MPDHVSQERVTLAEADLDDLRDRLGRIKWPRDPAGQDWTYGVGLDDLRALCERWRAFDWPAVEKRVNEAVHHWVTLDGLRVHAATVAPPGPSAGAIVLLHGWPSSFLEMLDLARELANPRDNGQSAYTVVIPSLPSFGLSDPEPPGGLNSDKQAGMLLDLMTALGHERFAVHAFDVAVGLAIRAALRAPTRIVAYHTTEPTLAAPWLQSAGWNFNAEEQASFDYGDAWEADEGGYMALQRTRPQTVAYGLSDSPVGLAAWLFEKWRAWTVPPGGQWDGVLTDLLLSTLTLYWATNTISTANRVYAPVQVLPPSLTPDDKIGQPVGVLLTAQQIERAPRSLVERIFPDLQRWTALGRYGNFVCGEAPEAVAASLRLLLS